MLTQINGNWTKILDPIIEPIDFKKIECIDGTIGIEPERLIFILDEFDGPPIITLGIAEKTFGRQFVINMVENACGFLPGSDIECELEGF